MKIRMLRKRVQEPTETAPKREGWKPLWEMSQAEFDQCASRGQIIAATGKKNAAEILYEQKRKGKETPLGFGEVAGYSQDDIAAFYVEYQRRMGLPPEEANRIARKWLLEDAIKENKLVRSETVSPPSGSGTKKAELGEKIGRIKK